MKVIVICLALLSFLASSACCKANQPPSFFCKVEDRILSCTKDMEPALQQALLGKILSIIASGFNVEQALQDLVDLSKDDALCVMAQLPSLFTKAPTADPAAMQLRMKAIVTTQAFLARRHILPPPPKAAK